MWQWTANDAVIVFSLCCTVNYRKMILNRWGNAGDILRPNYRKTVDLEIIIQKLENLTGAANTDAKVNQLDNHPKNRLGF